MVVDDTVIIDMLFMYHISFRSSSGSGRIP